MTTHSSLVTIGATSLHVRERDGGARDGRPALVFLHYLGGSGRSWEPVMRLLTAAGWRCIAPDARGFGDSPAPGNQWEDYTVDKMADDAEELAEWLGLGSFVLIGHSMGGKVSLAVAARQPAELRGVALVAPSPPTPEPMEDEERARMLAGAGDPAQAAVTLAKITAHALPPALYEDALADNARCAAPAWRAWLEHGSREDISGRMGRVRVPVRIAVGAEDRTFTRAMVAREIAARVPGGTDAPVTVLAGAAHLPPAEVPGATAGWLLASLAGMTNAQ